MGNSHEILSPSVVGILRNEMKTIKLGFWSIPGPRSCYSNLEKLYQTKQKHWCLSLDFHNKGAQWQIIFCLQRRSLKRLRFNPWIRKIPWKRKWQPTPVFFPGESYGQRRLSMGSQSHTWMNSLSTHEHHNKIPWTGWVKQQKCISHCSGGWEVQDQGATGSVSDESTLLGLQAPAFSLCPYMASPCTHTYREGDISFSVSSY